MAQDNDDTKPTVEDVDRVIREHDRIKVSGQDMKKAITERIAKGHGPSEDVQLKKGESLWDLADRVIGTAVGIVMTKYKLTAAQGFTLLVNASQHTNRKLRDLAADTVQNQKMPLRPTVTDQLLIKISAGRS